MVEPGLWWLSFSLQLFPLSSHSRANREEVCVIIESLLACRFTADTSIQVNTFMFYKVGCLTVIHIAKLVELYESSFLGDNAHYMAVAMADGESLFHAIYIYPLESI